MKTKVIISALVCSTLILFQGCEKESAQEQEEISQTSTLSNTNVVLPPQGGVVNLLDVGQISFPRGSFTDSVEVSLSQTQDPNRGSNFELARHLYNTTELSNYEIRISTADQIPVYGVYAQFELPQELVSQSSNSLQIKMFSESYYTTENEELMAYQLLPSTINVFTNKITAVVPPSYFSQKQFDLSSSNKSINEAVIVLALAPHRENVNNQGCPTVSTECQGEYITCPLESCDPSLISDSVGWRTAHPVTGVESCHRGTDIKVAYVPVFAASKATVVFSGCSARQGCDGGYGHYIVLKHVPSNSTTLYAHLNERLVSVNDVVEMGQQIGVSGNSGTGTGAHLHFEYYPYGATFQNEGATDPMPCISSEGLQLLGVTPTVNGINDCEHEIGVPNSGTSWFVTFDYHDPLNEITSDAEITFECLNCVWQTNGTTSLALPAVSLNQADGVVSVPDFCAQWNNGGKFEFEVYISTTDNRISNSIFFEMYPPPGANIANDNREHELSSPFKKVE